MSISIKEKENLWKEKWERHKPYKIKYCNKTKIKNKKTKQSSVNFEKLNIKNVI